MGVGSGTVKFWFGMFLDIWDVIQTSLFLTDAPSDSEKYETHLSKLSSDQSKDRTKRAMFKWQSWKAQLTDFNAAGFVPVGKFFR